MASCLADACWPVTISCPANHPAVLRAPTTAMGGTLIPPTQVTGYPQLKRPAVRWPVARKPAVPGTVRALPGCVGAISDNMEGIAGGTWNTQILPVRVLGKCGGYDSDIIAAMRWAAGLNVPGVPTNPTPAKILNLSLGGSGSCTSSYRQAISASDSSRRPGCGCCRQRAWSGAFTGKLPRRTGRSRPATCRDQSRLQQPGCRGRDFCTGRKLRQS